MGRSHTHAHLQTIYIINLLLYYHRVFQNTPFLGRALSRAKFDFPIGLTGPWL